MKKYTAYIADTSLLIVALIWGSGFIFMKTSLDEYTAIQLITIRLFIGGVILTIASLPRMIKKLKCNVILPSFFISLGLFFGFFFQTIGLKTTTAGNSAFLTAIYVILVPLIILILGKKKPHISNMIAAFLMLVGIFFMTYQTESSLMTQGNIYTMISAFFFAIDVILIDHYTKKFDPVILAALQMLFAAAIGYILLLITGDYRISIENGSVVTILYLGIIATGITFFVQNVAQKFTTPTHAGIIMSMEAVFGSLFGIWILNEHFTVNTAVGAGIIMVALIISEANLLKKNRKTKGDAIEY